MARLFGLIEHKFFGNRFSDARALPDRIEIDFDRGPLRDVPEVAIGQAMDLFWQDGFAATSLDTISVATGMNRPSLYGAFGDKREIYLKAYTRYRAEAREALARTVRPDQPLRKQLENFFATALDLYLSGKDGPRGCFTVVSAASEAVTLPEIREIVLLGMSGLDKTFVRLLEAAQKKGELPAAAKPEALAAMAAATIHTLALRARTRVPRRELERIANFAIDLICAKR